MTADIPAQWCDHHARLRAFVVDEKHSIDAASFDALTATWANLCALAERRPELGLYPVPMMVVIDNAMPQFLVSDLLAMRQAWYGEPQKPAEQILAEDPEMKAALRPIPKRVKPAVIGEMAVALGWVESEDVAQAVGVQVDVESETGLRLLLGTILVLHGLLDAIAYYQLLALRLGVPFTRYDIASLDRVKAAFLKAPMAA